MSMPHWPFIMAAYAVTILGMGGLLVWCWQAMRRAERAFEDLQRSDP